MAAWDDIDPLSHQLSHQLSFDTGGIDFDSRDCTLDALGAFGGADDTQEDEAPDFSLTKTESKKRRDILAKMSGDDDDIASTNAGWEPAAASAGANALSDLPPSSASPKPGGAAHVVEPPPAHAPPSSSATLAAASAAAVAAFPVGASDPAAAAVAAARFKISTLSVDARNIPNPVSGWVGGIVYCIANDKEISGSDDSLTGITMRRVRLNSFVHTTNRNQIGDEETGLELRFGAVDKLGSLKGPKGDLICRIVRAVLELFGNSEMFKDWESLRKHLTEVKQKEKEGDWRKNFSFIWTGVKRGGNNKRDFSQTYYERRYTPNRADLSEPELANDRKTLGGGGNPGLMEFFGNLFMQEHAELYKKAKDMAFADIATGLQKKHFQGLVDEASTELFKMQENPELLAGKFKEGMKKAGKSVSIKQYTKKKLAEYVAADRNAKKHFTVSQLFTERADLKRWVAANPKAIARSWLAAREFPAAEIEKIERAMTPFSVRALEGQTLTGVEAFRQQVLSMPEESAAAAAALVPASPAARTQSDAVSPTASLREPGSLADDETSMVMDSPSSPVSPGSLTRERSQNSQALSETEHRQKRTMTQNLPMAQAEEFVPME